MRNSLLLAVMGLSALLLCSCSSLPQHIDVTGKWNYNYGKGLDKTGSMTLTQAQEDVRGMANDSEGEFEVKGTLRGPVLTLQGKSPRTKKTFIMNVKLQDEARFKGKYINSSGGSGRIKAKRAKLK